MIDLLPLLETLAINLDENKCFLKGYSGYCVVAAAGRTSKYPGFRRTPFTGGGEFYFPKLIEF
jgi:hypothetical protein